MPVGLSLAPAHPVDGVRLATIAAGIKADGSNDLVLIELASSTHCAAVFTRNAFCAAPVTLCREHVQTSAGATRALLINAGNANAGTGQPGYDMALGHCAEVAGVLNVRTEGVLPFSTGVIGQLLPDQKMRQGIRHAATQLGDDWDAAARGIMTTDTVPKLSSRQVQIDGRVVTITGMAKGAGMIQPNMATMLSFLFTDAAIAQADLDQALRNAVAMSFNAITVDSDTSTNDAVVLCATGQMSADKGAAVSASDTQQWGLFTEALESLCLDLAQAIIRDAEGATKFITIDVSGGRNSDECKSVAYAVANSPLVKTAMFASDANVGRLLMAIGKADIDQFDTRLVRVSLGDVCAFEDGGIAASYSEAAGSAVLAEPEITVHIDLARGDTQAKVYTSDLSHDYVTINAEYRT